MKHAHIQRQLSVIVSSQIACVVMIIEMFG